MIPRIFGVGGLLIAAALVVFTIGSDIVCGAVAPAGGGDMPLRAGICPLMVQGWAFRSGVCVVIAVALVAGVMLVFRDDDRW